MSFRYTLDFENYEIADSTLINFPSEYEEDYIIKKWDYAPYFYFDYVDTIFLTDSDIRAFPGAEGHGSGADYGRGSATVYFVTNDNDTGAGSFRQALSDAALSVNEGIIIFRTGGLVSFENDLYIGNSTGSNAGKIYIAGQTAPGGGFGVRNTSTSNSRRLWLRGSDITLRYLKSYGASEASNSGNDALTVGDTSIDYDMTDIMLDHLTISKGQDENLAFTTKTSINQNTLGSISNVSLTNSLVGEPDSFNVIIYGERQTNYSFIGNYFLNFNERAPFHQGLENTLEYINNLIYYGNDPFQAHPRQKMDVIGNYQDPGDGRNWAFSHPSYRITDCNSSNCPPSGDSDYTGTETYYTDNTDVSKASDNATFDTEFSTYLQGSRRLSSGYTPYAASLVPTNVLADVGAGTVVGNDTFEQDQIDDFANRTGNIGWTSNTAPTLAAGTPYTDTDGDGLSDDYENANGGSVSINTRPVTATLPDGRVIDQTSVTAGIRYTHIDIFLADMANDWDNFDVVTEISNTIRAKNIRLGTGGGGAYLGTNKIN